MESMIEQYVKQSDGRCVDVYLLSGIKLVGYILKTSDKDILFRSAMDGKEGVIMHNAIASIFQNNNSYPTAPSKAQSMPRLETSERRISLNK